MLSMITVCAFTCDIVFFSLDFEKKEDELSFEQEVGQA